MRGDRTCSDASHVTCYQPVRVVCEGTQTGVFKIFRTLTKGVKKVLLEAMIWGKEVFETCAHVLTERIVALDAMHCVSIPDESIVELVGVW